MSSGTFFSEKIATIVIPKLSYYNPIAAKIFDVVMDNTALNEFTLYWPAVIVLKLI